MDDDMSLKYLLDVTGIRIPMRKLSLPMKVYMGDKILDKNQDIKQWIQTAKFNFQGDQEGFWQLAFKVSQFVWRASLKYRSFPPSSFSDLFDIFKNANPADLIPARYALTSTASVM